MRHCFTQWFPMAKHVPVPIHSLKKQIHVLQLFSAIGENPIWFLELLPSILASSIISMLDCQIWQDLFTDWTPATLSSEGLRQSVVEHFCGFGAVWGGVFACFFFAFCNLPIFPYFSQRYSKFFPACQVRVSRFLRDIQVRAFLLCFKVSNSLGLARPEC